VWREWLLARRTPTIPATVSGWARRDTTMTEAPSAEEAGDHEITITRVFDAPRERVFQAWTDPERFSRWFGPRRFTVPLSGVEMDVRPGGSWRACMVAPDGTEHPFVGVYREVAEPARLVLTLANPENPSDPDIELVTVTLADIGGRTEMVFHQTGHLPVEVYARTREGWSLFFDRLTEELAQD
jgi:uncharacterized protein YndB with AHSA1/START domain